MIDERYKDNNQEDANEFISNFLDGLLNEIGDKNNLPEPLNIKNKDDQIAYNKFYNRFYKTKGNSFLLDLFYSILKTQKVCKYCGKVNSIKFNAYNIIELPIINLAKRGNDIKFEDIIENYFTKEQNIDGECNNCGKNEIYETIDIISLSKYLIFYFGRTINDKYINNQIIFPNTFDFDEKTRYENTSVMYYTKFSKTIGHYTASCKCDGDWYYFNDTYVEKGKNSNSNFKPIILIYERI